jgi:hypothetical protein
MIIENKTIPQSWTNKPTYMKIMRKVLKNEDMKGIAVSNIKNNIIKAEYNRNLKENLPKILQKNSSFEFDNDLMTLVANKKYNIKSTKRFQNINEEYKEMIKKQNIKCEAPRPDSIKENLKNILDYRKKMATRFKYNNSNIKINKHNYILPKSRSQILNSFQKYKLNTISTSDHKTLKETNNIKSYIYRNKSKIFDNNLTNKEKTIKEYEDKFMITGMNNKQFKDTIIEENVGNYDDNNKINQKEKV